MEGGGGNMSVITSGELNISLGIPFIKILKLKVEQKINEHAQAFVECMIEKKDEKTIENLSLEKIIKITGKKEILFIGYIRKISIIKQGREYSTVIVELISTSCKLDQVFVKKSYQDISLTYGSIAEMIMNRNNGAAICKGKAASIDGPIYQYEETDWQFLIRMSSCLGKGILADSCAEKPIIYFGVTEKPKDENITTHFIQRGFSDKYFKMGKLLDISARKNYEYYRISIKKNLLIGDKIKVNSISLCIIEKQCELIGEEVIFHYILGRKEMLNFPRIYNDKLIGRVIEGEVIDINKEKLKVKLEIDSFQDKGTAYEYKYVPVTGNVMYTMPEIGAKVALYLENHKDSSGRIINALVTNNSMCTDTKDKKLTIPQNKRILLNGVSVLLETNIDDVKKSLMKIVDKIGISLSTDKKIALHAKKRIQIKGLEVAFQAPVNVGMYQKDAYLELQGDINTSSEEVTDVTVAGFYHIGYPQIMDEPEEGEYSFWHTLGQVVIATIVSIAVGALIIFTGGTALAGIIGMGVAIGGSAAAIGKGISDYNSGNNSSNGDYALDTLKGAVVGAVSAAASYGLAQAVGVATFARFGVSLLGEGTIGAGSSALMDILNGEDIDWGNAGISAGISAVTFGLFNIKNLRNLAKASSLKNQRAAYGNPTSYHIDLEADLTLSQIDNQLAAASDDLYEAGNVLARWEQDADNACEVYESVMRNVDATPAEIDLATKEYHNAVMAKVSAQTDYNVAKEIYDVLSTRRYTTFLAQKQAGINELLKPPHYENGWQAMLGETPGAVKGQAFSDVLNAQVPQKKPSDWILREKENTAKVEDIDDSSNSSKQYTAEEIKEKMEEYKNRVKDYGYRVEKEVYLTRGAILKCSCGTHTRRLDIKEDYGYRIYDAETDYPQPFMCSKDKLCAAMYQDDSEVNLRFYGVCQGDNPPEGETVILKSDKRIKREEEKDNTENIKGPKCCPIVSLEWLDAKGDKYLGESGAYGITTHSYAVCTRGGFIEPYSSGQEYCGEEDVDNHFKKIEAEEDGDE